MTRLSHQEAGDLYARWVSRTGMADTTKVVYAARVREYVAFLVAGGEQYAEALRDEYVRDFAARDFRRRLLTIDKKAPRTVSQYMSAIGSFYLWLEMDKPRGVRVTVPPSRRLGLELEDLRKVLRQTRLRGARDFAIASTLFYAGPRVSELAMLDTDDILISERGGKMEIRYGKGGSPRTCELNAEVRAALREWMRERSTLPGADTPALWLAKGGRRLSVRSIQHMLHEAGKACDVEVTPHKLRHTFSHQVLEKGGSIVVLRDMLGHRDIRSTVGYLNPRQADYAAAAASLAVDL